MSARHYIGCTPDQLRIWRETMGWTQEKAAAQTGVTLRTFQKYEAGHNPVPLDVWRSCKLHFLATEAFRHMMQDRPRHEIMDWIKDYAQNDRPLK